MNIYETFRDLLVSIDQTKEAANKASKTSYKDLIQSLDNLYEVLKNLDLGENSSLEDFKDKIMSKGHYFKNLKETRDQLGYSINNELDHAYKRYWKLKNKIKYFF